MSTSSSNQVKRWRVYCNNESIYVDGYLERSFGMPTTCFNNNTHTIDTSKTKLIELIDNNYTKQLIKWRVHCTQENIDVIGYMHGDLGDPVYCFNNKEHTISVTEKLEIINNPKRQILEQPLHMNGIFKAESISLDPINSNSTKILDMTWNVDIAPISINIPITDRHKWDSLVIEAMPDKVVGTLTQDITGGVTTVIPVSSTVIENILPNFLCCISDGTNTDDLGNVIDVDYQNNTITVSNTPTNSYAMVTPTYIKMTIRFVGPHTFGDPETIIIGGTKMKAQLIPKNEILRFKYTNNSSIEKNLIMLLEYYY